MSKKISISVALAMMFVAMTMTFAITMVVSRQIFDTTVNNMIQQEAVNATLDEMNKYVRGNYFSDLNEDNISSSTARGFINGLGDTRNLYLTPAEYTDYQAKEKGTLVDVGIEYIRDPGGLFRVVKVYPNSAAAGEGILTYTIITHIDDVDVKTLSSEKVFEQMLYGAPGTEVRITGMLGLNTDTYTITRIKSFPPTVEAVVTEDKIGYLRIHEFTDATPTELENAITNLIDQGVIGILFDVRTTSGRNYDPVFQSLKLICKQGTFAKGEYKGGIIKLISGGSTDGAGKIENLPPMVVLVNEKTSGPGELFAACAKNLGGASISGTGTAGNGVLVSKVQPLSDGSAISIITAKIIFGEEASFEGVGVRPDYEISVSESNDTWVFTPDFGADTQLLRSINYLKTIISGQPVPVDPEPDSSFQQDPPPDSSSQSTVE